MTTKALHHAEIHDLGDVVANLFVLKPKAPKNVAKVFTEAMDQYVQEMFRKNLENLSSQQNAPLWTAQGQSGGGVEQAVREGSRFKQDTMQLPEMLSSEEGAKRAGLTRQGLDERRHSNQALGLTAVKRGVRYPAWQFEDDIAEILPKVLSAFHERGPWGQYLFFTQSEPLLGGATPLDAIRKGRVDEVMKVVGLLTAED